MKMESAEQKRSEIMREKLKAARKAKGLRTCPHKRLRRVAMLEIITMASSEATEIS